MRSIAWHFLVLIAVCAQTTLPEHGVVVERTGNASELAKAGIQAGDVIYAWATGKIKGEILSPFDLTEVGMEYAPRGVVTLYGRRGEQPRTWKVNPGTPVWDITARPFQSGRLAPAAGPPWLAAWLPFESAELAEKTRQWDQVDRSYQEALERAAAAEPYVRAQILASWAQTLYNRDWTKAEQYLTQALTERRKVQTESLSIALLTYSLGSIAKNRGWREQAEPFYREALAMSERVAPGSLAVAYHLNNAGSLAISREQLIKAEDYFKRALAIRRKLSPDSIYTLLNNLGALAFEEEDLAAAQDFYQQAAALLERVDPASGKIPLMLNNLAILAKRRGDPAKSEEFYRKALVLIQKLAPASFDEAAAMENVAGIVRVRGNLIEAGDLHRNALAIRTKLAPESLLVAQSLANLGRIAQMRGEIAAAEDLHRQALAIREKLAPGSEDHAHSLLSAAAAVRAQGQLAESSKLFAAGLEMLERVAKTEDSEDQFAEYRSHFVENYRDYVDLLMERAQYAEAFNVLERSRARALLEMLAERGVEPASGLDAELQRERKANYREFDRLQDRILILSPTKDAAQIASLKGRLLALTADREQIAERIRRASPRLAAVEYPQPLTVDQAREALDPGTVLLSYSVAANRTALFIVRPKGMEPGLSARTLPVGEAELQARTEEFRRLIETGTAAARAGLPKAARALYDLLLKPAEAELEGADRLLIAPDGPLQVLPFAALLRNDKQFLVEWKPLHTAISATVYAELKRGRGTAARPPVELVAFGDPRYPRPSQRAPQLSANVRFHEVARRSLAMGRLPFSRDEVAGISGLFPNSSAVYLQEKATEEEAKSAMPKARLIHFATHAILDDRLPLNAALVLSIPENRVDGQENGLLQAWEIFAQVRLDADLVVLSACQTALGKALSGEGLIGLTRAFQYAGARSVVASLWSVDDRSTADLMKRFYGHLRSGKSKDEALRAAQREMIRSSASRPFYWAAFSLSGDWR